MVPIRLILSYFMPHIRKYKWTFSIPFIGYGISFVIGGIIKPIFYKNIMDTVTSSGSAITGVNIFIYFINDIVDTINSNPDVVARNLITLVVVVAIITVFQNIIHRLTDYAMVYSQSNIMRELNNYVFSKLHNFSYQFFANNFQGSLVAKSRRFVRSFESLHDNIAFSFWQAVIQLSGIFVVLFFTIKIVAWFFALWCIVFLCITAFLVHKKRKYDLMTAVADSRTTGCLADSITGALNIKMFSSIESEKKLFSEVTGNEEKTRRVAWNFNNLIHIVHSVTWLILEIVGLYLVVSFWIIGSVSAGTIVLVQTYFVTISGIMWNLRSSITNTMRALSDASEMVEIFEQKPDILDPKIPEPCRIRDGRIVFDNVSFGYDDSFSVFEDFNLVIEAGEKVGLVGSSGTGKTTTTKLILRFMNVLGGTITIDGQDIAKITQGNLRSEIAYVPQDPVLFHRTISENIAYARPDASEEEIIEVAQKANAHEFISRLSEGYNTFVGERGVKLSGGERQRIAIARAMLKDAPVIILDEATSSLDSLSEKYVQEAFMRLMENRTTIVVAHRLSTIKQMDRIIVLDDNGIIEEGNHEELLNRKGSYFTFWNHQIGGFVS